MTTYNYRCTKTGCRQRVTLRKPVEGYVQKKYRHCPGCGKPSLSLDKTVKIRSRKFVCFCSGYHFPHRKGSKWCNHYAGTLTDEDYMERHQQVPQGI